VRKLDHVAGMLLPVKPDVSDWIDPIWEPLWTAAVDLGFVLSLHAGKPRWMPTRAELAKLPHGMALYFHTGYLSVIESFTHIFWSGCFESHPTLKIVSVEGDIGWLPHGKERSDRVFSKFAIDKGFKTHPHEWFGRNFFATFEADPAGIRLIDLIGEDVLMWASDYPHSASSFPDSRGHIARHFGHLDPGLRRKLTWDTCARLYGIKPLSN
jgi:predicted TIM-barrel fold metal-dependent hydrolase